MRWSPGFVGLLTLLFVACSPIKVTTEAEPRFDPSKYHSYELRPPEGGESTTQGYSKATVADMQREIDGLLQQKGFRRGAARASDLIVRLSLTGEDEVRRVNAGDPDADYYVPKTFRNGTLMISFFDASRSVVVWRGSAEMETMIAGALVSTSEERSLIRAVRKVLRDFPARGDSLPQ